MKPAELRKITAAATLAAHKGGEVLMKYYRKKIAVGWSGLRIVSEGDSWFQYPFLLDDVIDQLFDQFAIFSLDAAGDLLQDMKKQDELSGAITAEQPQVVLLSGGGNDLLGDGRLHIDE